MRLSSNLSLATTESSNLISNAVVVWSLIAKALTLQGCREMEKTAKMKYWKLLELHRNVIAIYVQLANNSVLEITRIA